MSSDGGSAAWAGVGIFEPWLDAVFMELVLAVQFDAVSWAFLADWAFWGQGWHFFQLLVLLFLDRRSLCFFPVPSDDSQEGNRGKEWDEWDGLRSDYCVKSEDGLILWFLLRLLSWLRRQIERNELRGTVLIPHFFDCLWLAVLASESLLGDGDLRAAEAPVEHLLNEFLSKIITNQINDRIIYQKKSILENRFSQANLVREKSSILMWNCLLLRF